MRHRPGLAAIALAAVTGLPGALARAEDGYHDHATLAARLDTLAASHPGLAVVEAVGASREGRAITALRIAAAGPTEPAARPALLLAADLGGDHLAGGAVALGVATRLLDRAEAGDEAVTTLLSTHTIYVVPRVNPDAAERFFADVRLDRRRNVRPDDADRDGAIDEDPPNDLDGDGRITMMRVPDLEKADRMADATDPRLTVTPDRSAGERAAFVVYVEGVDDDGDGAYNEDGVGGVDLDLNFMHGYREHADGAGPYPVSEPESLALLRYALDRQNIAVVLVYGRHDNLTKTPDGKGTHRSGAPKSIDEKDVGLYKAIGDRFRELTGLERVDSAAAGGAFFEWAYAQFGVPSFTTPLWTRPEPDKTDKTDETAKTTDKTPADPAPAEGAAETDESLTPSGFGDIAQETLEELRSAAEAAGMTVTDEMVAQLTVTQIEGFAKQMGIEIRRVKSTSAAGGGSVRNADEAGWLAYSDAQGGVGFVDWTLFDHPQLGPVEIGGWVPYFRTCPPPESLPALAETQTEFVLDLVVRLPRVSLAEPTVTRLGAGLYEVKTALVNDGFFPTGTAMAVRNRRARPYVVRLDTPNEHVLTGQRVTKLWSIPGSGGRSALRWIVRADADLTITVFSEKFGSFDRTIALPAATAEEDGP